MSLQLIHEETQARTTEPPAAAGVDGSGACGTGSA